MNCKIKGYHATDKKYLDSILEDEFKYNQNDEHWLGNGIYFFEELELAKWWARNPTNKFGINIENSAIIEVVIIEEESKIVDLRKLEHYNFVQTAYQTFIKISTSCGKIVKGKTSTDKLRCAFFDWFKNAFDINVTIATFVKYNPEYVEHCGDNSLKEIHLPYNEVQICVYDNSCINEKKELKYV